MFPATQAPEPDTPQRSNTSKRRAEPVRPLRKRSGGSDEFGDDEFDEEELVKMACGDLEFEHIDNFANPFDTVTRKNTAKNKSAPKAKNQASSTNRDAGDTDREPVQLTNGRWACKHACKDKQACKHFCCKNGMDKPQKKPSAIKRTSEGDDLEPEHSASNQMPKATQSKLQLTASKRKISSPIQELDLTQEGKKKTKSNYAENAPREIRELHRLHNSVQKKDPPSTLHTVMHTRPAYFYSHGGDYNLSFLQQPSARLSIDPSDYGDNPMDDMNTYFQDSQPKSKKIATTQRLALLDDQDFMSHSSTARVASCGSDTFGDDDLLLGDAMVGLADSQKLQASKDVDHDIMQPLQDALGLRYEVGFHDDEFPMDFDYPGDHGDTQWQGHGNASTMPLATDRPDIAQESHKTLAHSTNSVQAPVHDLKSVKALRENSGQEEPRELVATQDNDHPKMSGKRAEDNMNVLDLLDMFERESVMEEKPVPQAFKGLEPWLFQEFGDIVELVDD
jgi:ATP-dependent DNA helicase HFM1/MER3